MEQSVTGRYLLPGSPGPLLITPDTDASDSGNAGPDGPTFRFRRARLHTRRLQPAVRPNGSYYHGAAGSMPFALVTAAASGVRRKLTSAFAASASLALAITAAAKTMVFWRSPGSGPTISMPATDINSTIMCTPISASPFATRAPTSAGALGLGKTVFDFISLAIPKRSSTLVKWMPLAPPLAGST